MSDSAVQSGVTFVHLRAHSAYSLSEGALKIKDLARLCTDNNMPALAITDTSNLFGALEFSETMAKAGIQPIIGCSLAVDFADSLDDGRRTSQGLEKFSALALLAKDEAGYRNLMLLSSQAFLDHAESGDPHVEFDLLKRHAEGLICLTGGGLGPVNAALVAGQESCARDRLLALKAVFDDRLYVELQRHGMPDELNSEPGLIDLAYGHEIPLVATNEPYFAEAGDFAAHDALICIAEGDVIAMEDRRRLTPEHCFKSTRDMATLFADLPEAIENTVEIALRCSYRPKPRDPILPKFSTEDREIADEGEELLRQSWEGLDARLKAHGVASGLDEETYRKRLQYELDVIVGMEFPGYFLIVADFIGWAKAQGIPVGWRGSGASSLVAWVLDITDLDPLRFNLVFERFLNPERISMPDFDIDFCQNRRDEVIQYVQDKYGVDQVAQIITFGKFQARAVCRDVGRVLQMPYGQVDRICKLIPMNPANPVSLAEAIEGEPRLQEERDKDEIVRTMLETGLKLEGLYRHASTHAAGIVIGDRPLSELVPLYQDPRSSMPATQFSMKWVEPAGLVKFDFLGLKTLTVLDKSVKLLERRDVRVKLSTLSFGDEATFAMLQRAETTGVFQLESSGMRDLIRKSQPSNFEDIIALVALYRPGPMENIPKYIASKKGEEKPEFLHELVEPIVADTYGIIIYQEQVMQIAQVLSGYSLGEADILRKAMGKKIKAEMDQQKGRFVSGAVAKGVDQARAEFIFELVAKFAGYGFNKSHSAAYALIAYQTAWLKANHPVEFLAASMTLDASNTDKLLTFKREAERSDIKLNPPCINRSQVDFDVADGEIQYALSALRNVGHAAVEHIVELRDQDGRFTSLGDFARRIDPRMVNRRALESLAKAGAFDCLNPNRAQVLAATDALLATANRASSDAECGQGLLFGGAGDSQLEDLPLPAIDAWLPMDQLREEFDAVGFYLSGHPLDEYVKPLEKIGVESWRSFHDKALNKGATSAKLAGTITYRQERRAKSGNKFAFIGLSDPTGQFEAICFSDTLAASREILEAGKAVIARVEADIDGEDVRLRLNSVEVLDENAAAISQGLTIFIGDEKPLESIARRLTNGGNSPVRLVLQLDSNREVEIALGDKFTVSPQIKGAIKAIPGVIDVHDL